MSVDAAPRTAPSIRVAFDDGANVIVIRDNCFVQRRTGPLSVEALDLMSVTWRSFRRAPGQRIAALFVLGEGAEIPERRERDRQRTLLDEIYDDPRFIGAAVIEGQGVGSSLKRTLSRAVGRGKVQVYADERPAVRSIARIAGPEVEANLLGLLEEARRLERR